MPIGSPRSASPAASRRTARRSRRACTRRPAATDRWRARATFCSRRWSCARLTFDLDSDATDEQRATLLKLTERYCVVYQTLRSAPLVTMKIHGG
jgi:hypothetical protein